MLDEEQNRESEILSLSTSGVYSSSVSAVSDSLLSPPLNSVSVDQLQSLCERSSAEHCLPTSASVDAVSKLPSPVLEWEHIRPVSGSSGSNRDLCLSANDVTNDLPDCDKALLKVEHIEALDREKEQMTDSQSVAVNSSLHKSNDSAVDYLGKSNAAQVVSGGLQDVSVKAKRTLHGRSASESGLVKLGKCFPDLPEHVNVQRRQEQGNTTDIYAFVLYFFII